MPVDDRRERGPYASGLARREAILDAAVDLLGEVGFHGMSLRDVARRVGISHPGVIYHFPSKDALLMAVVDRYEYEAGFDLEALAKMEPIDVLDSLIGMIVQLVDSPTIIEMECMLAAEAASTLHPAHGHFMARNTTTRKLLTKAWARLQLEGKVREDMEPQSVAAATLSLWHGLMTLWLYDRSLDTAGAMVSFILSFFNDYYHEEVTEHYRKMGWLAS